MKLEEIIDHSHSEVHEMILAPEPFSVFEDYTDFKLLIIRRVEFVQMHLGFKSEAYILKEKEVFYYDKSNDNFVTLKNSFYDLVTQLEVYYRNNQKIISAYSMQIEEMEEFLFDRKIPSVFMDIWFDLKKDLSKLENYYYRNGLVYKEFYKKSEPLFTVYKDEFKDIDDSIQFQNSNVFTLKTRLDGLHHYYDSIKEDRTNKTLLTLTVISGIFLPLNLIVGYFGINTPGLYFMSDVNGSEKVLFLLVFVLLISVLGIPLVHFIDHYILSSILGRYDFYKKMSTRIDEIGDRLRGK